MIAKKQKLVQEIVIFTVFISLVYITYSLFIREVRISLLISVIVCYILGAIIRYFVEDKNKMIKSLTFLITMLLTLCFIFFFPF
jgi:predicted PurR-regulated permease PerM